MLRTGASHGHVADETVLPLRASVYVISGTPRQVAATAYEREASAVPGRATVVPAFSTEDAIASGSGVSANGDSAAMALAVPSAAGVVADDTGPDAVGGVWRTVQPAMKARGSAHASPHPRFDMSVTLRPRGPDRGKIERRARPSAGPGRVRPRSGVRPRGGCSERPRDNLPRTAPQRRDDDLEGTNDVSTTPNTAAGDAPLTSYDAIIVGAGFSGATVARELAERGGKRVVVLEQRDHIGGNAYDRLDDAGVLIHQYGPHIFHTTNERVFAYLSRFTGWNGYSHEVLADVHGTLMPVPFNKISLRQAFGEERGNHLIAKLVERYGDETKVPISQLREVDDPELQEVAEYVWQNVFLHYTSKQWGKPAEQIDPSVTARVPVFLSEDSRYFTDPFQGLPADGYTAIFERLLDHPGIDVRTGVDARAHLDVSEPGRVLVDGEPYDGVIVYTGPLDELFGNSFGRLPYRSLDFEFETLAQDQFQPRGTINYTVSEDFTRITEFKHMTKQEIPGVTTIVREYSKPYDPDAGMDPYYPEVNDEVKAMHAAYAELAAQLGNFYPLGRLAEYQYYNMDATVASALNLSDRLLEENK